jgi:hypothetical protein
MVGMKASLVLEVASPNTMRITSYSLTGDCSQGDQSFCDALEDSDQIPNSQAVIELPDLAIGSYRIAYSANITTQSGEPLPTGSGEVSFDVVTTSHLSLGECSYVLSPRVLQSVEIQNAMEDPVSDQRWYLFLNVFPGIWEDISNTLRDPADHPPMTEQGFRPLEDHQLILVGNDPGAVQAAKVIVADSCTLLP